MMRCPKCNNIMRKVPIKDHVWMGIDKGYCYTKIGEEYVCDYCVWKGDADPGLKLKEIIKKVNNENQNTDPTPAA